MKAMKWLKKLAKAMRDAKVVADNIKQAMRDKAKASMHAANAINLPLPKYKKGNHEAALGGVIAGLAMLGGSLASTFDTSFASLLGHDSSYISDFLGLIGFVSLIGGVVEYKKLRK
nr:conjugal transfer protein [Saccharolobus solfataricus]